MKRKLIIKASSDYIFVEEADNREIVASFCVQGVEYYSEVVSGITSLIEELDPNCEYEIEE